MTIRPDGRVEASRFTEISSRRWKTDIAPIEGALDKLQRLRGVSFRWTGDGRYDIGLIAEEVGDVLPELVTFEEDGQRAKALSYTHLIPVLIEAIKEQQEQIEELQAVVGSLSARR